MVPQRCFSILCTHPPFPRKFFPAPVAFRACNSCCVVGQCFVPQKRGEDQFKLGVESVLRTMMGHPEREDASTAQHELFTTVLANVARGDATTSSAAHTSVANSSNATGAGLLSGHASCTSLARTHRRERRRERRERRREGEEREGRGERRSRDEKVECNTHTRAWVRQNARGVHATTGV